MGRVFPMRLIFLVVMVFCSRAVVAATAVGRFAGSRWKNIGPTRIDPMTTGGPWAGRVASVAIDPVDPMHWLVGAALGGVWESRDGGTTWVPRTDDAPSLASGAIAFAPHAPQRAYAATGESNGNVSG